MEARPIVLPAGSRTGTLIRTRSGRRAVPAAGSGGRGEQPRSELRQRSPPEAPSSFQTDASTTSRLAARCASASAMPSTSSNTSGALSDSAQSASTIWAVLSLARIRSWRSYRASPQATTNRLAAMTTKVAIEILAPSDFDNRVTARTPIEVRRSR